MENQSFTHKQNFGFDPGTGNIPVKPNNNLPLAIISTIMGCCSPCLVGFIVGIVAIVFAAQTDSKFNQGDYMGAEQSGKNARLFSYIALGLGVLGIILGAFMMSMGYYDEYIETFREAMEQA